MECLLDSAKLDKSPFLLRHELNVDYEAELLKVLVELVDGQVFQRNTIHLNYRGLGR